MAGTEPLCRAMGAEFIFAMATLKILAPGVVKRVFEAVYTKVRAG